MRKPPVIIRLIGYFFTVGAVLFVAGSAVAGFFIWKMSNDLPDYAVLRDYEPPIMTRLYASDGRLLAEYAKERRLYIPVQAIPDRIKNAFLSAEDKSFYTHGGLDFAGIVSAALTNVQNYGSDRRPVGASTITQQVAKNFLLTNDVSVERKIKEALLSMKIERAYSKDKILELYLNEIYLGLGSYGVAAASLVYFDKSVHELTVGEAAYLAALPKAPNNYHPFREPERAIERRNWVLDRMMENGVITAEETMAAKNEALEVTGRSTGSYIYAADYFAEEVRRNLYEKYGEDGVYTGGLSVRTTLNPEFQELAQKTLRKGLVSYDQRRGWRGPVETIALDGGDWGKKVAEVESLTDVLPWRMAVVLETGEGGVKVGLQPGRQRDGTLQAERETGTIPASGMSWAKPVRGTKSVVSVGDVIYVEPLSGEDAADGQYALRQVPQIQGAMSVMDPYTGRVLALVGGFSYSQSEFNRATQAQRQPGSSFKPFIYATALDNGYTPSSVVLDAPVEINQGPGLGMWRPQNYGREFYGPSTLRLGIEKSRNVMTVRLSQDIGMPVIAEYARRFGIYDNMMPVLSMSLGAGETTVLRMTSAYAMIANGGRSIAPTLIDRIQDRTGQTIYKHDQRICEDCNAQGWDGQAEPVLVDEREQILDPMTAYQITSMMEGVVQRGTATSVQAVGKPIAGKTGTTNDFKDAWFVGFSPDLAVGVYMGYDQPKPLGSGMTGGELSAPIFTEFMKQALADQPAKPFKVPPGMKLVRINAKTGMRAGPGDGGVIVEAFKPGTNPPDAYSIIGYESAMGTPQQAPDAGATGGVGMGTGGLY